MNRKQRDKNRNNSAILEPKSICPNCGQLGPHFVPPMFLTEGFFICDVKGESISLPNTEEQT